MYKCEVCGREIFKKHSLQGFKCLCSKHMHQLFKYGCFLDSNPRTQKDLNNIIVNEHDAYIELYDGVSSNIIGYCIIDKDDIETVKYHKWRLSHGRVITGSLHKGGFYNIGHIILHNKNNKLVVGHINGNPYDNRKSNLRLCEQKDNVLNKHFMSLNKSGVIGVCQDKRKERKHQWVAEIRYQNKKYYLGAYLTIEEAAYARYCGEIILFKEFRNTNQDEEKKQMFNLISIVRKSEIESYVTKKLHNLKN